MRPPGRRGRIRAPDGRHTVARGSASRERNHRAGDHPIPFRTRQLSSSSPMILHNVMWESRPLPKIVARPFAACSAKGRAFFMPQNNSLPTLSRTHKPQTHPLFRLSSGSSASAEPAVKKKRRRSLLPAELWPRYLWPATCISLGKDCFALGQWLRLRRASNCGQRSFLCKTRCLAGFSAR